MPTFSDDKPVDVPYKFKLVDGVPTYEGPPVEVPYKFKLVDGVPTYYDDRDMEGAVGRVLGKTARQRGSLR